MKMNREMRQVLALIISFNMIFLSIPLSPIPIDVAWAFEIEPCEPEDNGNPPIPPDESGSGTTGSSESTTSDSTSFLMGSTLSDTQDEETLENTLKSLNFGVMKVVTAFSDEAKTLEDPGMPDKKVRAAYDGTKINVEYNGEMRSVEGLDPFTLSIAVGMNPNMEFVSTENPGEKWILGFEIEETDTDLRLSLKSFRREFASGDIAAKEFQFNPLAAVKQTVTAITDHRNPAQRDIYSFDDAGRITLKMEIKEHKAQYWKYQHVTSASGQGERVHVIAEDSAINFLGLITGLNGIGQIDANADQKDVYRFLLTGFDARALDTTEGWSDFVFNKILNMIRYVTDENGFYLPDFWIDANLIDRSNTFLDAGSLLKIVKGSPDLLNQETDDILISDHQVTRIDGVDYRLHFSNGKLSFSKIGTSLSGAVISFPGTDLVRLNNLAYQISFDSNGIVTLAQVDPAAYLLAVRQQFDNIFRAYNDQIFRDLGGASTLSGPVPASAESATFDVNKLPAVDGKLQSLMDEVYEQMTELKESLVNAGLIEDRDDAIAANTGFNASDLRNLINSILDKVADFRHAAANSNILLGSVIVPMTALSSVIPNRISELGGDVKNPAVYADLIEVMEPAMVPQSFGRERPVRNPFWDMSGAAFDGPSSKNKRDMALAVIQAHLSEVARDNQVEPELYRSLFYSEEELAQSELNALFVNYQRDLEAIFGATCHTLFSPTYCFNPPAPGTFAFQLGAGETLAAKSAWTNQVLLNLMNQIYAQLEDFKAELVNGGYIQLNADGYLSQAADLYQRVEDFVMPVLEKVALFRHHTAYANYRLASGIVVSVSALADIIPQEVSRLAGPDAVGNREIYAELFAPLTPEMIPGYVSNGAMIWGREVPARNPFWDMWGTAIDGPSSINKRDMAFALIQKYLNQVTRTNQVDPDLYRALLLKSADPIIREMRDALSRIFEDARTALFPAALPDTSGEDFVMPPRPEEVIFNIHEVAAKDALIDHLMNGANQVSQVMHTYATQLVNEGFIWINPNLTGEAQLQSVDAALFTDAHRTELIAMVHEALDRVKNFRTSAGLANLILEDGTLVRVWDLGGVMTEEVVKAGGEDWNPVDYSELLGGVTSAMVDTAQRSRDSLFGRENPVESVFWYTADNLAPPSSRSQRKLVLSVINKPENQGRLVVPGTNIIDKALYRLAVLGELPNRSPVLANIGGNSHLHVYLLEGEKLFNGYLVDSDREYLEVWTYDANGQTIVKEICAIAAGCSEDRNGDGLLDSGVQIKAAASDPDGDELMYSANNFAGDNPIIDPETGALFHLNRTTGALTYSNQNGEASGWMVAFIRARDSEGLMTAPIGLHVHVDPVNDLPRVFNQHLTFNVTENELFDGSVRNNIGDPDNALLFEVVGPGGLSAVLPDGLTFDSNGTFSYLTPEAMNGGEITFFYRACEFADGGRCSGVASAMLNVRPVNDPPRVLNNEILVHVGDTDNNHVISRDEEGENAIRYEYESIYASNPSLEDRLTFYLSGQDTIANFDQDGVFFYDFDEGIAPDTSGVVWFKYRACEEGTELCSEYAYMILVVTPEDETASVTLLDYQTEKMQEDTVLNGSVLTDASPDGATYQLIGAAPGGVNMAIDGSYTYDSPDNFTGNQIFYYGVKLPGETAFSAIGGVWITVENVNDAPEIISTAAFEVSEDGIIDIPLNEYFLDRDGDPLEYSVNVPTGSAVKWFSKGETPAIDVDSQIFKIHLEPDRNGSGIIELRATDGIATTDTLKLRVTVNPVNDLPILVESGPTIWDGFMEDVSPAQIRGIYSVFSDADIGNEGDQLIYHFTVDNPSLFATDASHELCEGRHCICQSNVCATNYLEPSPGETEGVPTNFGFLVFDFAENAHGSADIVAWVEDRDGGKSPTHTFTVKVESDNEAPELAWEEGETPLLADITTDETQGNSILINALDLNTIFTDPEPESTELDFEAVVVPKSQTGSQTTNDKVIGVTLDGDHLTLTTTAKEFGDAQIKIIATDQEGASMEYTFMVHVESTNQRPEIQTNFSEFNVNYIKYPLSGRGPFGFEYENEVYRLADEDLAHFVTDADGDALVFSLVQPLPAGLALTAEGILNYNPPSNLIGTPQFTFQVCDPESLCRTGFVKIAVEDSGIASLEKTYDMREGETLEASVTEAGIAGTYEIIQRLNDDTTLTAPEGLTLNANGTFIYDPPDDFDGEPIFYYGIKGTDGLYSHLGRAAITVLNTNDPPEIISTAAFEVSEDGIIDIPLNEYFLDRDGDPLQYNVNVPTGSAVKWFSKGETPVIEGQILRIHLEPNRNGSGLIEVTATDGKAPSVLLNLTVTVNPVPDAPILVTPGPTIWDGFMEDVSPAQSRDIYSVFRDADTANEGDQLTYHFTVDNPGLFATDASHELCEGRHCTCESNVCATNHLEPYPGETEGVPTNFGFLVFDFAENAHGSANIVAWVEDRAGAKSPPHTFAVRVDSDNKTPLVMNPMADREIQESAEDYSIDIDLSDVFQDPESDPASGEPTPGPMTYTAQTDDGQTLSVTTIGSTLRLTYHANHVGDGEVAITVNAADDEGLTVSDTFNARIVSSNQPPIFTAPEISMFQKDILSNWDLNQFVADPDISDVHQFRINGSATTGLSLSQDGLITFDPDDHFVGDLSFDVEVCDEEQACAIATAVITVDNVNDAPNLKTPDGVTPVIENLLAQFGGGEFDPVNRVIKFQQTQDDTVSEEDNLFDTQFFPLFPGFIFEDPDQLNNEDPSEMLTFSIDSSNDSLIGAAYDETAQKFSIDYNHSGNPTGEAIITLNAKDSENKIASYSFTIHIVEKNRAPQIDPNYQYPDSSPIEDRSGLESIKLSDVFTDPEGDEMAFEILSFTGDKLEAFINDDGELMIDLLEDADGAAEIQVRATDIRNFDDALETVWTLRLEIQAVNDDPERREGVPDSISINATVGQPLLIDFGEYFVDIEGDPINWNFVSSLSGMERDETNPDIWSYTPAFAGQSSFTVQGCAIISNFNCSEPLQVTIEAAAESVQKVLTVNSSLEAAPTALAPETTEEAVTENLVEPVTTTLLSPVISTALQSLQTSLLNLNFKFSLSLKGTRQTLTYPSTSVSTGTSSTAPNMTSDMLTANTSFGDLSLLSLSLTADEPILPTLGQDAAQGESQTEFAPSLSLFNFSSFTFMDTRTYQTSSSDYRNRYSTLRRSSYLFF